MATYHVQYKSFDEFTKKFNKAIGRVYRDLYKPLQLSANWYIKDCLQSRFERERSPDDRPWKPLAPSTQRERKRLGFNPQHLILTRTGLLRNSFYYTFPEKNKVKIDNNLFYAKNLNKKRKFQGFSTFNRKDIVKVRDIFTDWTFKTLVLTM